MTKSPTAGAPGAPDAPPPLPQSHVVDRRAFLLGAAGAAVPLAAALRLRGHSAPNTPAPPPSLRRAAQTAASPVAATPVPATATGEMIGRLRVVRDQRPTYDATPTEAGRLQIVLTAGANLNFNPAAFRQDFQIPASYLDPLVWIDEVTMEPRPWLATAWEWADDGKSITYTLQDDVRWHDGEPLTADDVAFSLLVYRDDVDSAARNLFTNLLDARAVDDHTVEARLSSPDGNWLLNASSQFIFQRRQYIDVWESKPEGERTLSDVNWRRETPIGTGPWRVDTVSKNEIGFARNEDYWQTPPYFHGLTLTWSTDPTDRLVAWTGGRTDVLWPIRPSDVDTAGQTNGWLYVADAASVMFAAFNFDNPSRDRPDLLGDLRIRQAISAAIDRDRYAAEVFRGFIHQHAAGTVAQPWAYDPVVTTPPRNVAQALALLKAAGYEDRDDDGYVEEENGNRLVLTCIVRNDARAELFQVLESIVPDLADAGIALVIQRLGDDQFRHRWVESREYDLIAYAYNLFPGFTDFDLYGSKWDIRENSQGWNPGGYQNADVDAAIETILEAVDPDAQRRALSDLQRAANDDLFGVWFGFPQDLILVRPEILGFQPNKQWQTWDTRKLWRPTPEGLPDDQHDPTG